MPRIAPRQTPDRAAERRDGAQASAIDIVARVPAGMKASQAAASLLLAQSARDPRVPTAAE